MQIAALGDPIAHGRTADLYAWTPDTILKLFHPWVRRRAVEHEAAVARAVHDANLPVPGVGDLVVVAGCVGLVYTRVEGQPLWAAMTAQPWRWLAFAHLLADLHARIHTTGWVPGVPLQRERLRTRISAATGLSEPSRQAALAALAALPDGDRLCHGDFHPGNVIRTSGGPIVIDWIDATLGNPLADVARTTILIEGVRASPGRSRLETLALGQFHKAYLRRYFAELSADNEFQYHRWLPVVAAARLAEGITDLEPWLLKQVTSAYGGTAR
jgi:aminoglycoside phosphotransferase (APT) family kinase protein